MKAAIARVLGAASQRGRAHRMRNALAPMGQALQSMASAALRQAFLQPDQASARQLGAISPTSSALGGRSSACRWTGAAMT
ncbi:hypothetical protein JMJ55_10570 [Belnapia sp. T6]|uniref:Uncharacterized protein n=1 Tax=Belnapia mucosa TaxID=2804532 RepID=A0ABS1V262_9PROT|nr:hypothetical protein [Belnapia mucosa]